MKLSQFIHIKNTKQPDASKKISIKDFEDKYRHKNESPIIRL